MNLQQLKQLAEAVESAPLAHRIDAFCRATNPATILQMIALIEQFSRAAYPLSKELDERGYRWSDAYLDEALTAYKEMMK